jgi:predicted DCC family thiol-disulfide oxidoreductase YuxK
MDTVVQHERGLLIFDGDCGFCTTSARFASRWVDRHHRYDIQPWQQLDLDQLGLTEDDCIAAAQFVRRDGSVRAGHLAIAEGLKHGAPPWRPLGHAMTVPGISAVAGKVYAWVADHRYAMPGGTPACAPKHPTVDTGTTDDAVTGASARSQ